MHNIMTRFTSFAVVAVSILILATGCTQSVAPESKQYQQMKPFAEKLRAYVAKALDDGDATKAQNVAIASVFFVKEMNYGAPKRSKTTKGSSEEKGASGERGIGLVSSDVYRKRIEGLLLNPDAPVEKLREDTYNSLLGWALSKDDMKAIQSIRDSSGYWNSFKASELQNDIAKTE